MTNKDIEALLNHWHIRGKLLVGDIIAGIGGCRFYYEMDPVFLDKIYKITGTHNGILMNDHKISLIINADTEMDDHPVISFFITFDKSTGDYLCIENVQVKDRPPCSPWEEWECTEKEQDDITNQVVERVRKLSFAANSSLFFAYFEPA